MNVICYGDSNTFGYDPRSGVGKRYDAAFRWVDILTAETGMAIRNNGMNGREIPRRETVFPKSTDLLIVMLGTNDILQGKSSSVVAERMAWFLEHLALDRGKILLIAPPPLQRGEWVQDDMLIAASAELAHSYRILAKEMGIRFADAGEWGIPVAYDGVHFTEEGNKIFAIRLRDYLESFFGKSSI